MAGVPRAIRILAPRGFSLLRQRQPGDDWPRCRGRAVRQDSHFGLHGVAGVVVRPHILFLIGFRNRVLVFIQWAWSYFTYERGARLITGYTDLPGWDRVRSGRAGEGEREMSSVIDK